MHTGFQLGKSEDDQVEDPGIDRKIILKWTLNT